MNVLVTGTGGFIGFHLAKELVARGHQVRGLFLPQENAGPCEELGVDIFRGDLTDPESLKGVTSGIDTVFHLATRTLDWGTRKQFEEVMVDGTRHLLEESAGDISRFVYVSSIAAFGLNRDLEGANEDSPRMESGIPYCDTKIIAEDTVKRICRDKGIAWTIVRPANVIGPGSVWVREILDAFLRGPFPLINGGKEPGAFVYVTNLVDGMIRCAASDKAVDRIYLFRDDYPMTWGEYIRLIGGLVGKKPVGKIPFRAAWTLGAVCETIFTPLGIRPPVTRLAAGVMGKNNNVDARRAREELGWRTMVSQDQAMEEIAAWAREEYRTPDTGKVIDFHNQLVCITGGSSGIGLETACLLAQKGAHLVLIARDEKKLNAACQTVESHRRSSHQKVVAVPLDVSDFSAVQSTSQSLLQDVGVPDILINNAGVLVSDYFENIDAPAFDNLMKINVYGVRNMTAALLPAMKARKKGRIVILSSLAGLVGIFGYTGYCASKFALIGFSEALRSEVKPHNISVSVVCPPKVTSPMDEKEAETITPETRAVKGMAGTLTPRETARAMIRGIQQKRFLIIPGMRAKLLYLAQRFSPGFISRAITDFIIRRAQP